MRIVATLADHGIVGKIETGSGAEKLRVEVPRSSVAEALSVLLTHGLPQVEPPGLLEALGEDTLVTTARVEELRVLQGLAGELERSLSNISGVVSARVHLATARATGTVAFDHAAASAQASVLLRYAGMMPPISETDIKRLLTGAVPHLAAGAIELVLLPAANAAASSSSAAGAVLASATAQEPPPGGLEPTSLAIARPATPGYTASQPSTRARDSEFVGQLSVIGPFAVAPSSKPGLTLFLVLLSSLNALLMAAVGFLWFALRRRSKLAEGRVQQLDYFNTGTDAL